MCSNGVGMTFTHPMLTESPMTRTLGWVVLGGSPGPILQQTDVAVGFPSPSPHPALTLARLPVGTMHPNVEGLY